MAELFGCAHVKGCPDPFACRAAGKCAAFAPAKRPPSDAMPAWPDQARSQDNWNDYNQQLQAAAIARVNLGRATLVMMAAQCDECHGKRCQYCENTWKIIDQLEVPAWLR